MCNLSVRGLGVKSPTLLFQNLSFTVSSFCRIGIVAGNGGGKTTLLRCIAGDMEQSEGSVIASRGLRMAFVEQDVPPFCLGQSLFACLYDALPEDQKEDWRVEMLLDLFAFPASSHQTPIAALSGGWQKLAMIARGWATDPDFLLLDEPTNHLDLTKIIFLEEFLRNHAARLPMLIVSHDRQFLEHSTTHTLFLRPAESKLYAHPYGTAKRILAEEDEAQVDALREGKKEADRLQRSANALKNIGINSHSDAARKKAQQMAHRAAEVRGALKEPHKEKTPSLRLASDNLQARVVLSMDHVSVRAPDGRHLFTTGKIKLLQGDRVLLMGENGAGKTQLIQMIRKAFTDPASSDGITLHPSLVLGATDQLLSHVPDFETPFGLITSRFDLGDQRSRTLLAGAGIPVDRQDQKIGTFSLGQKARLGFLLLRLTRPNFYVLDEPTNHLDIAGQERLEAEILAQNASALFVTHDRAFASTIATRTLRIEKGRVVE